MVFGHAVLCKTDFGAVVYLPLRDWIVSNACIQIVMMQLIALNCQVSSIDRSLVSGTGGFFSGFGFSMMSAPTSARLISLISSMG